VTYLSKQDICDLVEFADDHIDFFNAVPCEFATGDGRLIPYDVIWSICQYMLPDDIQDDNIETKV